MALPQKIRVLIDRFQEQQATYTSGTYNETMLRRDFLDPFLRELGWDIDNEQGHAEAYREVIHEDAVKVGSATKAPDYSCRIGGVRKFFVEAKKPSVNIKGDPSTAYQLRRYGWSAGLPLSILTDFQEFAVYDCRQKPKPGDGPAVGRIFYCTYDQYAEHWEFIASVFSREAILRGAFDRYAEEATKKRGTAAVDDEFLKEIESWRELLAKNIALRNADLSEQELNFAVQKTIDRIIFLRICEDRGIETYGRLLAAVNALRQAQGDNIYGRLKKHFRDADALYNSGLFHFRDEKDIAEAPDTWTLGLQVDDAVLRKIIAGLYYPESPYEFSVLPADLLGHVYEQFLGKVIRLTAGHRAKVEEKPEVRKAGGVYYTPTYIVEYIVEQTVGKLLAGRTPKEVAKLRIVDPACGSGSFLLGAYTALLDWHLQYYAEHDPKKWKKELYQTPHGDWRLTTAERKRILLNNLYGVDIDAQAVEVTKLSLLLKVLEGETQQTVQMSLLKERVLPSLSSNIKCGNSLIGPDFFTQRGMFDESVTLRSEAQRSVTKGDTPAEDTVNPFDWKTEFPEVFSNGGFDAVIGNPPYIFGELHDEKTKQYIRNHYALASTQYDLYWLFIEKGLNIASPSGYFSLIVPDALLARDSTAPVRKILLDNGLNRVYHCGLVFQKAAVSAMIFCLQKGTKPRKIESDVRKDERTVNEISCTKRRFDMDVPLHRLLVHASDTEAHLLNRLSSENAALGTIMLLSRGEEVGRKQLHDAGKTPILIGEDIQRYIHKTPCRYIDVPQKDPQMYKPPKIVITKTGSRCIATLDREGFVTMQSVYNAHVTDGAISPEAVLGILNSTLVQFFIAKTFTAYKFLFPQLNQSTIEGIPIPTCLAQQQKPLVALVDRMLLLHKKLPTVKTPHEQEQIKRQIAATDKEIDDLVFDLYGVGEEERKLILSTSPR
jgi:type I restriction-modification system DNA methylase subunit